MSTILLLLCVLGPDAPAIGPDAGPDALEAPETIVVETTVSAVVAPGVPTAEELAAIDRKFVTEHHWELGMGSCRMICGIHGGWKLVAGPDPSGAPPAAGTESRPDSPANAAEATSVLPAGGCPGGKCKLKLFKAIKKRIKGE